MSQMPALARTDLRSTAAPTRRAPAPARSPRPASRPVPGHLRLVTAAPRPARQMPFLVLCSIVLAAGLLAVLFLNMQLAKGSYALHDLQRRSTLLAEQEGSLTEHLAALESPGVLASKATKLGMVPGTSPAFLRLPDGQVLGVPQAAPTDPSATPPASKSTDSSKDAATDAAKKKAGDAATPGASAGTAGSTKQTPSAAATKGASPSGAASDSTANSKPANSEPANSKPKAAAKPSASGTSRSTSSASSAAATPESGR